MATLDRQVAASADDCFVYWDGLAWVFSFGVPRIRLGYHAADQYKQGGGMRFLNITIPKGATIDAAYLTITARDSDNLNDVNSKIHGEDVDDAATFSDLADYQGRDRTTAVVNWDGIASWTENVEYNSPEIKTIIQEIIDRAGWASGNDLVIFWDDHDDRSTHTNNTERTGKAYDYSTTACPKLHIEYTSPAAAARSRGYIMG
jgi:hypothetical protein